MVICQWLHSPSMAHLLLPCSKKPSIRKHPFFSNRPNQWIVPKTWGNLPLPNRSKMAYKMGGCDPITTSSQVLGGSPSSQAEGPWNCSVVVPFLLLVNSQVTQPRLEGKLRSKNIPKILNVWYIYHIFTIQINHWQKIIQVVGDYYVTSYCSVGIRLPSYID